MAAVVAIPEAIMDVAVAVATPFSVATTIAVFGLSSYCSYSAAITIMTVIVAAMASLAIITTIAAIGLSGSSFCYSSVTETMAAASLC